MRYQNLHSSIEYLSGVGPQRGELLNKELGIFTFRDLLFHFPFRHIDRSEFHTVSSLNSDLPFVQLIGKIHKIEVLGASRGQRLVAHFSDDTGSLQLVWFKGVKWIKSSLKTGVDYVLFGKANRFKRSYSIPHPELELAHDFRKQPGKLQPIYHSTEKLTAKGLTGKAFGKLMGNLIPQVEHEIDETLSREILDQFNMPSKSDAVKNIHFPTSTQELKRAKFRLKFEELFFIQLELLKSKSDRKTKVKGFVFSEVGTMFNRFFNNKLPFDLTSAQKRVIKEIRRDLGSGQQMNRLLQGDVGSGKTIVALMCMLLAIDNGFQSAIMAPTEILATQHYNSIIELVSGLGLEVGLLTGSTKTSERKILYEKLQNGTLDILIGTHALIEDRVNFQNLGFVVVDEQHRFGVKQRAKLWNKNPKGVVHVLVMTATPIPRTLAMTFYGDLDVSVIDEMPPGRKPIKTVHRFDKNRLKVFGFMKEEIKKGRQVYVVYPLIEESQKLDYKDLTDGYESICREFPLPDYAVSIVHGRMKPEDKDFEMQRFVNGETQIMVSTTVIEVGVNVPNASVMVIESAHRFGLSQLHQLRGRVGRGADQSYCVLLTDYKLTQDGKVRMETMCGTNDGFEIAEVDLKLRGPGDLMGTKQSGILELKIADIARDGQILQLARDAAVDLLKKDPMLNQSQNAIIARTYANNLRGKRSWGRIS